VDLIHISLDEASCLAGTIRVVVDNCLQELKQLWSRDPVDIGWIMIHGLEM